MLPGAAAGPGIVPIGLGIVPMQARYGVVFASHDSYIEQVVSRGTYDIWSDKVSLTIQESKFDWDRGILSRFGF
jgi:hypothetical protein